MATAPMTDPKTVHVELLTAAAARQPASPDLRAYSWTEGAETFTVSPWMHGRYTRLASAATRLDAALVAMSHDEESTPARAEVADALEELRRALGEPHE